MKIISWNVVSLRNMLEKANLAAGDRPLLSFLQWLKQESPDIACFQETKLQPDQIPTSLDPPPGYYAQWCFADKKGYSGVGTFSRKQPLEINTGLNITKFDVEGRVLMTRYPDFRLFNVYFPKAYSPREVAAARRDGTASADRMAERLPFKLAFYDAFLEYVDAFKARGEKIIICGDFNVAHTEIDLARPKENRDTSGFLPEERAWMDKLTAHGYLDSFRCFNREPGHYTWWSYRFKAREKDIGWRLDYFFISENLRNALSGASILKDVFGSDHCPVGITLKIS